MNIYVGNISFSMSEEDLQQLFEEFGEVTSAKIIKDRFTGRSRGFGFVEMADNSAGNAAIEALNEKDYQGRPLRVNEARPQREHRSRNY
ncbi:MAG: RNA recognition motif domain-containing protein [Fidelibacterota bacterium]